MGIGIGVALVAHYVRDGRDHQINFFFSEPQIAELVTGETLSEINNLVTNIGGSLTSIHRVEQSHIEIG